MDSKLLKMAILASSGVVILVVLIVIGLNANFTKPNGNKVMETANMTEDTSMRNPQGQIGNDLSAFLQEPYFFDDDPKPSIVSEMDQYEKLGLMITSVEKDMRVHIVDEQGNLVTGESFLVEVEDVGEFKDLDKDGVIYVANLKAGDYAVKLMPMEGYRMPDGETQVKVKDKVEYVAIADIASLIKTEDEIDPVIDDTRESGALLDADPTEIVRMENPPARSRLGIDVSKWQREIDWDMVADDGVEFAIIRAGYRGSVSGSLVEDPFFKDNIKGAMGADLSVGVYFFTQAINEVEAVEEASMVLALIKGCDLDYPIYIDTEGAGGNGRADGLDVETRTKVCDAFCRTIENAGYTAGVYASRNWFNTKLSSDELAEYVTWLAEYRSTPLYQGPYQMWQYTSKGTVSGIVGNVDLDISYY